MKKCFFFLLFISYAYSMEQDTELTVEYIKRLMPVKEDKESDFFKDIRALIVRSLNRDSRIIKTIIDKYPLGKLQVFTKSYLQKDFPVRPRIQQVHYGQGYLSTDCSKMVGQQYVYDIVNKKQLYYSQQSADVLSHDFNLCSIQAEKDKEKNYLTLVSDEKSIIYPIANEVYAISCKPDDTAFAYSTDGEIIIFCIHEKREIKKYYIDKIPIKKSVTFNWHPVNNELWIISNGWQHDADSIYTPYSLLDVWNIEHDTKKTYSLANDLKRIIRLVFSPDCTKLAFGSLCGDIYIYEIAFMTRTMTRTVKFDICELQYDCLPQISIISWSPDSSLCLLCVHEGNGALIWDYQTNKIIKIIYATKNQRFLDIKWLKNNNIVMLEDDHSVYSVNMESFVKLYKFLTQEISLQLSLLLLAIEKNHSDIRQTNAKLILSEDSLIRYNYLIKIDPHLKNILDKYVTVPIGEQVKWLLTKYFF